MPRIGYSAEQKEDALRLCDKMGVQKASVQTGILAVTLYKWRERRDKPAVATKANKKQAVNRRRMGLALKQANTEELGVTVAFENEELLRLQLENDSLKAQIETLKRALRAFGE